MKTYTRRLTLAILVLLMISITACSGTALPSASANTTPAPTADASTPAPTTDASTPTPTADVATPAPTTDANSVVAQVGQPGTGSRDLQPIPEGDWKQPYAKTVNISTVKRTGSDVVFDTGDNVANNPWTRAWKQDLNIEQTYLWVDEGGTQYDTKLNMAIASKALPDVFKCNYIQFRQLIAAGLIQDITDVYNKNTSQRVRDYEKTDPNTIKLSTIDGKIYGIPEYYYGIIDQPKDLWVRKDWYEAAGKPAMKTVANLESLAKTFIKGHGGYGLGVSNTLDELYMTGPMFKVYLGTPSNGSYYWYKDSTGKIKADITHPEFKTALETWAKWYKDGILNPDFANTDTNKMNEDVVNGKAGMQPYYQWHGWLNGPNLVAAQGSKDAYMIPLPFPTVDGSQVIGQVGFPNSSVIVVNKDCKNPAAVMKLISFTDYVMFDPKTVLTEEQFKGFTGGQREHVPGGVEIIDPQADMIQFEHVLAALKSGDTSQLFTAGMKKKYGDSINWITKQDSSGLGAFCQQGFDGCSYDNSKKLIDAGNIIKTNLWGPPPVEFDKTVNTMDVALQGITKIIMGDQPISSLDKVLADWYTNGGKIMEDAVNKQYGGK